MINRITLSKDLKVIPASLNQPINLRMRECVYKTLGTTCLQSLPTWYTHTTILLNSDIDCKYKPAFLPLI